MLFSHITTNHPSVKNPSCDAQERGASMVEYALLVALIAIVAIVSLRELGNTTANQFVKIVTELGGEMPIP